MICCQKHSPHQKTKAWRDFAIRVMWPWATFSSMSQVTGWSKWAVYHRATVYLRLHRSSPRPPGYRTPHTCR